MRYTASMAGEYNLLIITYLGHVFSFPGVRYVWRPDMGDVLVHVISVHR